MADLDDEELAGRLSDTEDPVPFLQATIATADADSEYSFVIRADGGAVLWPMVPVGLIGAGELLVAWPAAAGPQYGGQHHALVVPAAAADAPGTADPAVAIPVVLELFPRDLAVDLYAVAQLPVLGLGRNFAEDGSVPHA